VLVTPEAQDLVADADKPLSQAEQARADNGLSDAVIAGTVRHGNEAALNTAVRNARWKPSGNTRVLAPAGPVDISPVKASALAVHGLSNGSGPAGWMLSLP
jgi:hypothetical protein